MARVRAKIKEIIIFGRALVRIRSKIENTLFGRALVRVRAKIEKKTHFLVGLWLWLGQK